MDDSCLYCDWVFTTLLTVLVFVVYFVPKTRYHPTISFFVAWSFFCWVLQFFFLEYGVSTLESSGHANQITLAILAMALVPVLVLWLLACFVDLALIMLMILVVSQTQVIDVSIPVAFAIALVGWLLMTWSPVSNIKQAFAMAVYTSGFVVFGVSAIILNTSTAVGVLPVECQQHFNMWLTCDAQCSGILTYDSAAVRVSWALAFLVAAVLRLLMTWIFTPAFFQRPKLQSSCCFLDMVRYNDDRWISLDDRKVTQNEDEEDDRQV